MALQLPYKSAYGPSFESAYYRITSVNVDKGGGARASVDVFSSKEDADAKRQAFPDADNVIFQYDLNSSDNVWVQAYKAMKADPAFVGAIDV